jgi:hypothetical protein
MVARERQVDALLALLSRQDDHSVSAATVEQLRQELLRLGMTKHGCNSAGDHPARHRRLASGRCWCPPG